MTRAEVLVGLRTRIAAAERNGRASTRTAVLPFGIEPLDRHLPGGGLALGAGPEVEQCAAAAVFAASLLARHPGRCCGSSAGATCSAPVSPRPVSTQGG